MAGADTVIFRTRRHTDITATDLGVQLSADTPDNVAAVLLAFARDVRGWAGIGPQPTWADHCGHIRDMLSTEERRDVAEVLQVLTDHLLVE
jgi:hypothetical protein